MSKTVSKFALAAGILCPVIVFFALPIIAINVADLYNTCARKIGDGWAFADKLKYIAEVAGNLFICLGVVFAGLQLFFMKKNFEEDHEQRKKRSTIEFYNNIQEECEELLAKFSNDKVTNVPDTEKDENLPNAIKKYLRKITTLSFGINSGIYDIDIFDKTSSSKTIELFDNLKDFISKQREYGKSSLLYKDFEDLVSKLKILQEKKHPVQVSDSAKKEKE